MTKKKPRYRTPAADNELNHDDLISMQNGKPIGLRFRALLTGGASEMELTLV